jgi:hypothetical protein
MRAITYTKYGPAEVLSLMDDAQLKEVEKPITKENEVLVKVIKSCIAGLGVAILAIPLGKEKF